MRAGQEPYPCTADHTLQLHQTCVYQLLGMLLSLRLLQATACWVWDVNGTYTQVSLCSP